jgi:hypothetical protein
MVGKNGWWGETRKKERKKKNTQRDNQRETILTVWTIIWR